MNREEKVIIDYKSSISSFKDGNKWVVKKCPKRRRAFWEIDYDILARETQNIQLINPNNKNPYIISLLASNEQGEISLEFMNCGDVSQFLEVTGWRTSLKAYLAIALRVLQGLASIHSQNLIYLDLKPANILLHFVNNQAQVKLCDFGSAFRRGTLSDEFEDEVSILYTPPEIFALNNNEPASPEMDIFSFGVFLKEIIQGRQVSSRKELEADVTKQEFKNTLIKNNTSAESIKQEITIFDKLTQLYYSCTRANKKERPLLPKIIQVLEEGAKMVGGIGEINKSLNAALGKYHSIFQSPLLPLNETSLKIHEEIIHCPSDQSLLIPFNENFLESDFEESNEIRTSNNLAGNIYFQLWHVFKFGSELCTCGIVTLESTFFLIASLSLEKARKQAQFKESKYQDVSYNITKFIKRSNHKINLFFNWKQPPPGENANSLHCKTF